MHWGFPNGRRAWGEKLMIWDLQIFSVRLILQIFVLFTNLLQTKRWDDYSHFEIIQIFPKKGNSNNCKFTVLQIMSLESFGEALSKHLKITLHSNHAAKYTSVTCKWNIVTLNSIVCVSWKCSVVPPLSLELHLIHFSDMTANHWKLLWELFCQTVCQSSWWFFPSKAGEDFKVYLACLEMKLHVLNVVTVGHTWK